MESVNKTETHQMEDGSKDSGANLLKCPSCGSRAYGQANCLRVFYSPLPSCKTCIENGEDFTPQPSCFFNPQFLQPIFHRGLVSQNCCSHGGMNTNSSSKPGTRDSVDHECGNTRRKATAHTFCQKVKQNPFCDKANEKNGVSENEPSHLTQCQNQFRESQWNYQSCGCVESMPWSYSPFIIPVVSCCVLWNPQNSNENYSNYSCSQMENLNRKNEDAENDLYSNTESNEKYDGVLDAENECAQEDCSEDGMSKRETGREHNRSSSSFLSLHSSANDENKIYNIKKKSSCSSVNAESDGNSDEATEELQTKRSVSSSNIQNRLSAKSNENILSNIIDYSNAYFAGNESQRSSTAESEFSLKAEDSSAEAEVDDQVKHLQILSEENDIRTSPKTSLESLEAEKNSEAYKNPDTGSRACTSKISQIKSIKNFTVTSRKEGAFQGKQKTLAAGGDLGGNTCAGFKVQIESEEIQFENSRQATRRKNFESKQNFTKESEERNSVCSRDKKSADSKTLRGPKTGIAKLIQGSRSRDVAKNLKQENKESNSNDTKRRVFANDCQNKEEKSQKEKSLAVIRQQKTGPGKQVPTPNSTFRLPKKEEKFSAPKVRQHNCERNSRN